MSQLEHDFDVTPAALCWHCDRLLTGAAAWGEGEEAPEPGAVSMCLYCSAVGIFDDELVLRQPTKDELDECFEDADFRTTFFSFNRARQYLLLEAKLLGVVEERKDDDQSN